MITSRTNSTIKLVRSLKDKKNRDRENLFVVEGFKMVKEALLLNKEIKYLIFTENGYQLIKDYVNSEYLLVSDDVYESISDEVSPQGVLAVLTKERLPLVSPKNSCLLLDGVSDPANVGAIIRTALASGYKEIYIADGADAYSPKSVRASMSGIYGVKIFSGTREEILKVISIPLIATDMKGENVFSCKIKGNYCIVIGNEAHGISNEVKEKAKYVVTIPMQSGIESLNASVSAGIVMYALKQNQLGE